MYDINLLESMLMAKDAWDDISSMRIEHCWDHIEIQCLPIMLCVPPTGTQ